MRIRPGVGAMVMITLCGLSGYLTPYQPATAVPDVSWVWPLSPRPQVVRVFDPPPQRWMSGHRGVDLAGQAGTPVRAAAAGVVRFADELAGRPVISIAHRAGLRTTYEPVVPIVAQGAQVAAGEVIGLLQPGHADCPQPACLHWGLRTTDGYLDPLALPGIAAHRVRLLPIE